MARTALRPNAAPVGLNDAARDVQAKTQAAPVIFPHLPEALEHGLQRGYGDAFSRVVHTKFVGSTYLFAVDSDATALGREFDGVGDQIGQNLQQSVMVKFRCAWFLQLFQ